MTNGPGENRRARFSSYAYSYGATVMEPLPELPKKF
jgi:hypothetical protein